MGEGVNRLLFTALSAPPDMSGGALIFAWGFATAGTIFALAIYQLLTSLNAFEPFIVQQEREGHAHRSASLKRPANVQRAVASDGG